MPRRARLRLAAYPVHVIQRGNNRSACFASDTDYLVYLAILNDKAKAFDCAIHACVLMTNHVHLLVTPARLDGVSLMMKHLGEVYVRYFNRNHQRTGTLWEGRFRSGIVQERGYLLACYRYIELNPVRAGMVAHPRDYRWSSYRANAEAAPSTLITPHAEYLALAPDEARLAAYRALFEGAMSEADLNAIRAATNGGYAIGDTDFKAELAKRLGRRVEAADPGRPRNQLRQKMWSDPELNRGLSPI